MLWHATGVFANRHGRDVEKPDSAEIVRVTVQQFEQIADRFAAGFRIDVLTVFTDGQNATFSRATVNTIFRFCDPQPSQSQREHHGASMCGGDGDPMCSNQFSSFFNVLNRFSFFAKPDLVQTHLVQQVNPFAQRVFRKSRQVGAGFYQCRRLRVVVVGFRILSDIRKRCFHSFVRG